MRLNKTRLPQIPQHPSNHDWICRHAFCNKLRRYQLSRLVSKHGQYVYRNCKAAICVDITFPNSHMKQNVQYLVDESDLTRVPQSKFVFEIYKNITHSTIIDRQLRWNSHVVAYVFNRCICIQDQQPKLRYGETNTVKRIPTLLIACFFASLFILPACAQDKNDLKHATAHLNRDLNKASKSGNRNINKASKSGNRNLNKASKSANRNVNASSKHTNRAVNSLSKKTNKEANRESKDLNHTIQGNPDGKKKP